MRGDAAIVAEGLGKRYRLGEHGAAYDTLRGVVSELVARRSLRLPREELWALRDVSFTVGEGEVLGIVGRNGAGKSTLLKILARITDPTEGRARVRGSLGALLEVGTAFNLELTGRENIEINGALLGMSRRDIRRRFDEIVEFSGVGRFLDTPLKRYSSGMYMRLAFAVAAHFEPDVVVVDEVLAVGDAEFQRRCLGKMSQLHRDGRTIVFVSHDLGAIAQLCSRTLWIEDGAVRLDGPTEDVITTYLHASTRAATSVRFGHGEGPAQLVEVAVTDADGRPLGAIDAGRSLGITLRTLARERLPELDIAIWVANMRGVHVLNERLSDDPPGFGRLDAPGEHVARLVLPPLLVPGEYVLGAWLASGNDVLWQGDVLTFHVLPSARDRQAVLQRNRLVAPEARWVVEPARPPGVSSRRTPAR